MDVISVVAFYFEDVATFNYTNAKNKIKSVFCSDNLAQLLNWLTQFADYDRNYYNLVFVTHKQIGWINRKKHSESFFELRQQMEAWRKTNPSKDPCGIPDLVLDSIEWIVKFRCDMIDFFRMMVASKSKPLFSISEQLPRLEEIKSRTESSFQAMQSELLIEMYRLISLELETLTNLLWSHDKMANLYFVDPLNALQRAQDYLDKLIPESPSATPAPLIVWLRDLSRHLLDKFTLYFQPVLSRHCGLLGGAEPDCLPLVERMRLAVARQGQSSAAIMASTSSDLLVPGSVPACSGHLLFDTTQQSWAFVGHGYALPSALVQPLIGIQNYQTIYSTAGSSLSQNDLFVAVSLVREKLSKGGLKVAHVQQMHQSAFMPHSSSNARCTSYFVCRLEARMFLLLVFDSAKSEKDRAVQSTLTDLCGAVQAMRLVDQLSATITV